jgi:prepilin-type N-terminal cleavage/methylation domain-containing protein
MVRTCARRGFTLVELLIVIAIIAMLVGLLLPAVQSARESARRTQCGNNIKQLALGAQQHVQSQGFFPSGGWGYDWTGDADRGFGKAQPGGWAYAVLPFSEQMGVFQMGAGLSATAKSTANKTRAETAVPTFYCPSRRSPKTYPRASTSNAIINADTPTVFGKTDYVINGGTVRGSLTAGISSACLTNYPNCQTGCAGATSSDWYCDLSSYNGVNSHRSEITPASVTDGLSQTLLIGEKYLNPNSYETGAEAADNGDTWQGYDWDVVRWTSVAPRADVPGTSSSDAFGGAHALAFMTAACDGSVRAVAYTISPSVWASLGHRKDGAVANWK